MSKVIDIIGQKFGKLTVIKRCDNAKDGRAQWLCKCGCGNRKIICGTNLKNGGTRSCGCLYKESNKGNKHPFFGKKHSAETKKKISETRKERILSGKIVNPFGEISHNWKGGVSFEPYPSMFNRQLKDRVRVRDNFICQLCGVPELECNRRLAIHHIDHDKTNCNINNLISLCVICNSKVNSNIEKWEIYFHDVILKKSEKPSLKISLN